MSFGLDESIRFKSCCLFLKFLPFIVLLLQCLLDLHTDNFLQPLVDLAPAVSWKRAVLTWDVVPEESNEEDA